VLILRVEKGEVVLKKGEVVPTAQAYCGRRANIDPRTEPWCPFDRDPFDQPR
jgi:hypothetical protein